MTRAVERGDVEEVERQLARGVPPDSDTFADEESSTKTTLLRRSLALDHTRSPSPSSAPGRRRAPRSRISSPSSISRPRSLDPRFSTSCCVAEAIRTCRRNRGIRLSISRCRVLRWPASSACSLPAPIRTWRINGERSPSRSPSETTRGRSRACWSELDVDRRSFNTRSSRERPSSICLDRCLAFSPIPRARENRGNFDALTLGRFVEDRSDRRDHSGTWNARASVMRANASASVTSRSRLATHHHAVPGQRKTQ